MDEPADETDSTNEPVPSPFLEQLSDTDLPEVLFHYTDIYGLQGIWEKGELWLTGSLFMNDTSELELGTAVVEHIIAERRLELMERLLAATRREIEHRKAGADADSEEAFISDRERIQTELDEFNDILASIEYAKDMTAFIACFTRKGDQLSQWRGYAREGYCIGLKTSRLLEHCGEDSVVRRVRYYGGESKEDYTERTIEQSKAFRSAMLNIDALRDDEDTRKFVIGKYALLDAAFVKDGNFREEEEVRIVRLNGEPNLFTPHRYGMVPRLTLPISRDAIVSVRVGPSAHADLKQESLKRYFLNVGFGKAPLPPIGQRVRPLVYGSKIPFRDW